jgi:hypothetical protein
VFEYERLWRREITKYEKNTKEENATSTQQIQEETGDSSR